MISVQEAISLVTLTRDEDRTLAKLEAAVDSALHEKFDGAPARLEFKQNVSPKVAHALQRRYEEKGGWRVTVNLGIDTCVFTFLPVFFTVPTIKAKPEIRSEEKVIEKPQELPPVVTAFPLSLTISNRRLLVRMPTRGRPVQALSVLTAYKEKAGAPIILEVVIDEDDETMLAADVLQRLAALGCVITVGKHKSKIEAINGGKVTDWDILLLASDDMFPVVNGYAKRVIDAMEEHFPHLDGVVYFDDGYQGSNLCTLPIMGKRIYQQFGHVYNPEYISLFSDTEQTELFRELGRLKYIDEKIIEHRHFVWGKAKKDELYQKNEGFWKADQEVYERRKRIKQPYAQFGFDSPPLWLSILICTLPSRRNQLDYLIDHIYSQIMEFPRQVEVLIDNRVGISIGEKRQSLLEKSHGRFTSFVDDDDLVSNDYVKRILGAIRGNPEADCVSLIGMMTTAGKVPERFEHSIKYQEWYSKDGVHYRSPNHLSPVRRDLALQVGFVAKNHAEDFEYSMQLRPLLKKEVSSGDTPAYYYFFFPGKAAGV